MGARQRETNARATYLRSNRCYVRMLHRSDASCNAMH
jgi:hypothetical protein